ncbi:hypothetical protein F7725_027328 [Dissostichus mawsoni]|uniref:DNA methyltransferase 1-associated 1 domain-containing protein n=1 Tax=Dissostichus mawsoni TaxID=36200 RepID=A0A7J5XCN7_DISMA|nr:hypothetical protein F7725_027328 [Dissostichus mawsoni]
MHTCTLMHTDTVSSLSNALQQQVSADRGHLCDAAPQTPPFNQPLATLAGGDNDGPISKKDIINSDKKKSKKATETLTFKRPEGMHREVYALLYSDKKDAPPLLPSDTTQGYRTVKAKLGCKKVRPWKWMPFSNPARRDGAIFNLETRCRCQCTRSRSIRCISMTTAGLKQRRITLRAVPGTEPKIYVFDAGHERRRKEQLDKLFNRTPEQVAEEEYLTLELRKIESRKREREKKAQDLQKLIKAADTTTELRRAEKRVSKKKLPQKRETEKPMKLPSSVGQKKIKAIEQILQEQGVDLNPMPTEEMVQMFNELRSDLVLLYELKQAHSNCEYEQQMLRHRYEALLKAGGGGGGGFGGSLGSLGSFGSLGALPASLTQGGELSASNSTTASTPGGEAPSWPCTDDIKLEAKEQIIDVVGAPLTPNSRKRRESASSSSSVKKGKKP